MTRLFVRHKVNDYDTWRKVYDDFNDERYSTWGVIGDDVYRSVEDGNDITVSHDFETLEAARAMVGAERLREVMADAGVASEPEFWFVEKS